jgi:hypothetical protein
MCLSPAQPVDGAPSQVGLPVHPRVNTTLLIITLKAYSLYLKKKKDLFMRMSALFACMPARQKRTSDPIINGFELPCGCWELNSGPVEEQQVL